MSQDAVREVSRRGKLWPVARPLRLEHAGAIWHVTSRGNARQAIVADDADRARFVETLGRVVPTARWRLHAWVLMTNHYHLLVETTEPTLARGMRQLNGIYAQAFNSRHHRVGHLFHGRYRGILVERESHLLELVRYVVLNPVRAEMVRWPWEHDWSSYAQTAGLREEAEWLEVDWTLAQFGTTRAEAQRCFRDFVSEGDHARYRPWDELRGRGYLGTDRFAERLAAEARQVRISPEVPRSQCFLAERPDLALVEREVRKVFDAKPMDLARSSRHPSRKAFALLARRVADAPLAKIAASLRVSSRSASYLIAVAEALEGRDPAFKARVVECRRRLGSPSDHGLDHRVATYPQPSF